MLESRQVVGGLAPGQPPAPFLPDGISETQFEDLVEGSVRFRRDGPEHLVEDRLVQLGHGHPGHEVDVPELVDGETVFKQTPEDMAARVKELVDAGANIIGGCCGTTPAHIAAIKAVIDELR